MKIKVHDTGYVALVSNHKWLGVEINTGDKVDVIATADRQIDIKGEQGIIKKIYYSRFWRYENCFVSVFLPNFNKTIWLEADSLEFQN